MPDRDEATRKSSSEEEEESKDQSSEDEKEKTEVEESKGRDSQERPEGAPRETPVDPEEHRRPEREEREPRRRRSRHRSERDRREHDRSERDRSRRDSDRGRRDRRDRRDRRRRSSPIAERRGRVSHSGPPPEPAGQPPSVVLREAPAVPQEGRYCPWWGYDGCRKSCVNQWAMRQHLVAKHRVSEERAEQLAKKAFPSEPAAAKAEPRVKQEPLEEPSGSAGRMGAPKPEPEPAPLQLPSGSAAGPKELLKDLFALSHRILNMEDK